MAVKERTSVLVDRVLLKRARKALRAANNTQAIAQALTEAVVTREIDTTLSALLRKGRGRFVDVYRSRSLPIVLAGWGPTYSRKDFELIRRHRSFSLKVLKPVT